ncbi:(2Fe-2S) ferredoxin domain-containing protein [Calothrix sp. UHCC 0171]|uniref:(2Fe-2S) ferredoxin domain-containing protein n=1 Tax=Calothrix sp. UHCC 0171 TaxID=3110245 RepID=UPI002B1E9DFE|nr:(2Fe-2S) ferredoxin domain-containing protein [Calothrix sp. UHCC 0171]MEA5569718.1 (2Fe-2S) ferredoxin domain-containing protein [Calothrix sp. UHCC 0171]
MGDKYLKLSEFDIEGEFLGFSGNRPQKFKYLQFALAKCNAVATLTTGNLKIKLPKELRTVLGLTLVPGNHIRIIGHSKLHSRNGNIKLKAYDVIPLDACHIHKPNLQQAILAVSETPSKQECSPKAKILVCQGSGCRKRGAKQLLSNIEKSLCNGKASKEVMRELRNQVKIQSTGCLKKCSKAPNCIVQLGKKKYSQVKPNAIASLLEEHLS